MPRRSRGAPNEDAEMKTCLMETETSMRVVGSGSDTDESVNQEEMTEDTAQGDRDGKDEQRPQRADDMV